jgi:hypothetical protein
VGVLELKNFSQFAVICATAAEPEAAPEAVAEADAEAGALDPGPVAEEVELLLQAAIVAASARPSAGAAIRRARRWDRMTRLLSLGRTKC